MIPLHREQFPSTKADLAEALDEAAHRFIPKNGRIVEIRSRVFPYLDEIAVNFDGVTFDSPPPPPPKIQSNSVPAFEAAVLNVSGRGILVAGVPINSVLVAHDLGLHRAQDENGNAVLAVEKVRDGRLSISVSQLDLENAIEKITREKAPGLTIDQVRLAMRARGPRSIALDVHVHARKLFLRARIDISGQIQIDDDLVIKISNLRCRSDRAIGSVACSALEPIFRQLEEKSFSIRTLPLGQIQVRDIRLAVADTVEITADFGSASA
jgi:hypothetical protein